MKAGVLKDVNEVRYMTVADPHLGAGDMLIKVKAATICGTDIRILRGRKTAGVRYPSILGHEFSGVVADTGGDARFTVGQAVCVCPQFGCGHCDFCMRGVENLCSNLTAMGYQLDGAFAEYVCIPAAAVRAGHVMAMPEGMSFETAALAEPLACVMNGQELAEVRMGDVVAILGAGPIGILHVKLARLAGARRIIVSEPSELRRNAALAEGADIVLDPAAGDLAGQMRSATGGQGADVAILAVGVPALASQAVDLVRKRGRISLFAGFSRDDTAVMDVNTIHYNELKVIGSFGLTRLQFTRALALIASGRLNLDALLTHRFGLSEIEQALRVAEQGAAIKVAII